MDGDDNDLKFPKSSRRRIRRKHPPSILHSKAAGTCYLCARLEGNYRVYPTLHEHHVFGGANRKHSEEYGLKVYLCLRHHIDGPEAVHNNSEIMNYLRQTGQQAFEDRIGSREEFMRIFGRSYL